MKQAKSLLALSLVAGCGLYASQAAAVLVAYTDFDDFQTALSDAGLTSVLHDFDDAAAGTALNGATIDGISFSDFTVNSGTAIVTDAFSTFTVTPPNSLGTTTGGTDGQFENGDGFTMTFPETTALGLWFLTSTPASAFNAAPFQPFSLEVNSIVTENADNASPPNFGGAAPTGADGYFIGVIDLGNPFSSAIVGSFVAAGAVDPGAFQFRVDNVYTAAEAPLPSSLLLLAVGLGLLRFGRLKAA